MNTNTFNKEELNKAIFTFKKKEIYYHRFRIAQLSRSMYLHPEKTNLSIKLQKSLKRLEYLLSA